MNKGDIMISPVPAGSKSGGAKILAAIVIAALIVTNPAGSGATLSLVEGGQLTTLGFVAASVAVNLALTGIQQLMAPDPATDADQEQSYLFNGAEQNVIEYLFNGAEQNVIEGDPVPILYGRLRVPGQPVNFEIAGFNSRNSPTRAYDGSGHTYIFETNVGTTSPDGQIRRGA
jgi:predicted phage tail protein